MRKIILDLAVSLDGFIEGPDGEIDWITASDHDDAAGDFLGDLLDDIDTVFYGRKSFDLWGEFVPGDDFPEGVRKAYEKIHTKKKIVFSTSKKYDGNVITIGSNIGERVDDIRRQPGKNIWLFGGGSLITTFINLGLVDMYRLGVYPVILGEGKPLFKDISTRVNLNLLGTKSSASGVILLKYERVLS